MDCLTKADAFKCDYEDPGKTVCGQLNKELVNCVVKNQVIMECIVWAIVYLGKQGLALQGRREDPERGSNPRNFLSLLHLMAENDEVLRNHLLSPEMRNAKCTSLQSQNEIISITGMDFVWNHAASV